MSDSLQMLSETADRLFADLVDPRGQALAEAWPQIEDAGFPSLLLSEEAGGFGGDFQDAFAVFRLVGYHGLSLPVAEAVLAVHLGAAAGLAVSQGLPTVATRSEGTLTGGRFSGNLKGVPFGADATTIVATVGQHIALLKRADATAVVSGTSPAGEPRDTLVFEGAAAETGPARADALRLCAFARTAQIAGALDATLMMSIAYANERVQFGKPIGKFQAVQQALAVFAEEAAAVNCAGQAAARALDRGEADFEIAAAKLRANMAAGVGHATAHQVHGAIGFTKEHALHHLTRRLVAWRTDCGNDRFWAEALGGQVAGLGPEGLWPELTRRGDAA